MASAVAVLDTDPEQAQALCNLLEQAAYGSSVAGDLAELETKLANRPYLAVMIDVDTVVIDNRTMRELTLRHPGVYFFCLSHRRFHPELKDAICYHIYACLNKPVNPDELFYLLRSINEKDSPGARQD